MDDYSRFMLTVIAVGVVYISIKLAGFYN